MKSKATDSMKAQTTQFLRQDLDHRRRSSSKKCSQPSRSNRNSAKSTLDVSYSNIRLWIDHVEEAVAGSSVNAQEDRASEAIQAHYTNSIVRVPSTDISLQHQSNLTISPSATNPEAQTRKQDSCNDVLPLSNYIAALEGIASDMLKDTHTNERRSASAQLWQTRCYIPAHHNKTELQIFHDSANTNST